MRINDMISVMIFVLDISVRHHRLSKGCIFLRCVVQLGYAVGRGSPTNQHLQANQIHKSRLQTALYGSFITNRRSIKMRKNYGTKTVAYPMPVSSSPAMTKTVLLMQ